MEESTNCWEVAHTKSIELPFTGYISHVTGENWLYTLLRSTLLATPNKLDEVFNYVHYCFEHDQSEASKKRKTKQEGPAILLYWQEKAVICPNCTSLLIQLLASSWSRSGQALSKQQLYSRLELTIFGFPSELIDVMANLYEYTCTAYERLVKETKNALQAKTYSEGVVDACTEYYGDMFDVRMDPERLEALLTSIHETNVHSLCERFRARHHIEDTLERDKQVLSKRTKPTKQQTIYIIEETKGQEEQQTAITPTRGKNYEQNRRKSEKKKQKRANAAKINYAQVPNDPQDSLQEIVDKSIISIEGHDEPTLLNENATHLSQNPTAIENIGMAHNDTSKEGFTETSTNMAAIAQSAASSEIINEVFKKENIVVFPTAIEQPIKIDYLKRADISEVTDSAMKSAVISDSAESPMARVAAEPTSYQCEQLLDNAVDIKDDGHWTQVLGTRKKSKKVDANSDDKSTLSVQEGPRFGRSPNKPQGVVKLGTSREVAPSPIRLAQTFGPWQKQQTVSKAVSNSTIFLSEGAKSLSASTIEGNSLSTTSSGFFKKQISRSSGASAKVKVDVLPLVPEVPTISSTTPTIDTHYSTTSPSTSTSLTTVAAVAAATSTTENHFDTNKPDLASTSTITDPSPTAVSIAHSSRVSKKPIRFSPSESIDPGLVPYCQHLQPYKGKGRRRMSETTEVRFSGDVTPLSDAITLVESLRDAGVEDNAMYSLVSRAAGLTTSTTHHLAPPDAAGTRSRAFACKHLDLRRANNSPRSAGNSPIPPQPSREPVYHYPPPDVLTPENQDILDRIIKGPPYPKYPRVPIAVDQRKTDPLAADFVTKKPFIVTYDGKDAYEVLRDRCPAPLTIKDHPDVNKCVQQGEIFHCVYCRVEISGSAELERGIICPGCGPCSETRYCQRSHLLADSIKHSELCGKMPDTYPLLWSELPLDYQGLYPYIKPLSGTMTAQCFRQMAHCLVINSDGIIENPYKALFEFHMSMEHRVKCYDWIQMMNQFQDKGSYYLFHPNKVAGGVDIEQIITLHDGSGGNFREDQRFARVRNAAFLTNHPTLLCVLYRRIKDFIKTAASDDDRNNKRINFFNMQFRAEFPSLDLANITPLDENYCFENDWKHVRCLVHDLELGNPILRAWIMEDAEDDGIPADPTARYQGKYWAVVLNGPTFRAGSADRKDWGPGWFGGDEKKWQKQLDRKYLKMINDELAKVEVELEGEII